MELYREKGYDQTTVAEIAERAGLTERTFFRYYADKREVLFGGSETLQNALVTAMERAPPPPAPSIRSGRGLPRRGSSSSTAIIRDSGKS